MGSILRQLLKKKKKRYQEYHKYKNKKNKEYQTEFFTNAHRGVIEPSIGGYIWKRIAKVYQLFSCYPSNITALHSLYYSHGLHHSPSLPNGVIEHVVPCLGVVVVFFKIFVRVRDVWIVVLTLLHTMEAASALGVLALGLGKAAEGLGFCADHASERQLLGRSALLAAKQVVLGSGLFELRVGKGVWRLVTFAEGTVENTLASKGTLAVGTVGRVRALLVVHDSLCGSLLAKDFKGPDADLSSLDVITSPYSAFCRIVSYPSQLCILQDEIS